MQYVAQQDTVLFHNHNPLPNGAIRFDGMVKLNSHFSFQTLVSLKILPCTNLSYIGHVAVVQHRPC